jgi:hypothetical protein
MALHQRKSYESGESEGKCTIMWDKSRQSQGPFSAGSPPFSSVLIGDDQSFFPEPGFCDNDMQISSDFKVSAFECAYSDLHSSSVSGTESFLKPGILYWIPQPWLCPNSK